ncbi:hypothetical protein ACWEQ5_27915 [Streptomyces griseoincarnatus]
MARTAAYGARSAYLPGSTGTTATEARPGPGGVLNALSGARYFNHPATVARGESKPAQLRRLARRAPSNWQECDGCERVFRAPEPGRCRDCRHDQVTGGGAVNAA